MKPVTAAILTIGDELLAGDVVNSNAVYLAKACSRHGVEVVSHRTVRDRLSEIVTNLQELALAHDICVLSGGLGPTSDDLTTAAVASAAGVELARHPAVEQALSQRFAGDAAVLAINLKQADFPVGAEILENPIGSAPGFALPAKAWLRHINGLTARAWTAVLPGVPSEMSKMMDEQVLPRMLSQFGTRLGQPVERCYRLMGLGESAIGRRVELLFSSGLFQGLGLATRPVIHYRALPAEVLVTMELPGLLESALSTIDLAMQDAFGEHLYAISRDELPALLHSELELSGLKIGFAESCTGGLVSKLFTDVVGASSTFEGTVVCYSNRVKMTALDVDSATLAEFGAVSPQVAVEMAKGALRALGVDFAVAITGIAGPGGGSPAKPVGTVEFACASNFGVHSKSMHFRGGRAEIRQRAAAWALRLALDAARERRANTLASP